MMKPYFVLSIGLGALVAAATAAQDAEPMSPEEAEAAKSEFAERARARFEGLTFEQFEAMVPFYPEIGKYVVNGDVPIRNRKLLREFFERNVRNPPPDAGGESPEFAILNVGGLDQIWSDFDKRRLTYCVSDDFLNRHALVVADTQAAAEAWEAAADIDFIHLPQYDATCDAENAAVMFDIRPIDVDRRFLAVAFFPNDPRDARSIFIDESAFLLPPGGALTLRGVMRHELGHTLGARHEHTRPEAGACFEDADWRGVTDYDAFSVMHYPQCNGLGDWTLRLTGTDRSGVACVYGPAPGFVIDETICEPASVAFNTVTERFTGESVAEGRTRQFGPFPAAPGTRFVARLSGSGDAPGDPDLYLKFGGHALPQDYDCRPFMVGPEETCDVTAPPGAPDAGVGVHGYRDGRFDLEITYTQR